MQLLFEVRSLTSEVKNLTSKIDILEADISRLKKENAILRKENFELRQEISILRAENKRLRIENVSLKRENARLRKENKELREENAALKKEVAALKEEVKSLKGLLKRSTLNKNSSNSHLPPSNDFSRKNKSLRKPSGRKPGGQAGHKGDTLKVVSEPDKMIDYIPDYCKECGNDLSSVPSVFIGRRQVIELPPIKPVVIQHNIYKKTCSCGYCTESNYPKSVHAPISYGTSIESLAAYFHTRQYVPYKRMEELFSDVLGIELSAGTLTQKVDSLAKKSLPYYQEIRKRLERATSVGSDETGVKVAGSKAWIWTWQNKHHTFITYSDNRGFATVKEHFKEGFPFAVLQHDI